MFKVAGVPDKQAEAMAEAQADILGQNLEDLATKRDLKEMELSLENRLVKWVAAMFIGQSALIIGAMFAMFKAFTH